jgi:hypothetical protein
MKDVPVQLTVTTAIYNSTCQQPHSAECTLLWKLQLYTMYWERRASWCIHLYFSSTSTVAPYVDTGEKRDQADELLGSTGSLGDCRE